MSEIPELPPEWIVIPHRTFRLFVFGYLMLVVGTAVSAVSGIAIQSASAASLHMVLMYILYRLLKKAQDLGTVAVQPRRSNDDQ